MSNPPMNVLVYGANGWIGQQFVQLLVDRNIRFMIGKSRVDHIQNVSSEIDAIAPTHVVSFIGRTHGTIDDKVYPTIDYLEQPGKLTENVRDNLFSPIVLAQLCSSKQIHYTYLGTGCIFKYDDNHPFGEERDGFTETSLPNFFGSSYSIVKGFTDQLMSLYSDNVLNLRIRMPITAEKNPRNFITKIVQYSKICSIPNSMSVLPELLPIALDMMAKRITGTVNLTNKGLISHNQILEMYKEIVDPTFTWENFSQEEQRAILSADRSNNYMETLRLEEFYPDLKHIKDAVRECIEKYKRTI
jgi:nucleoside-diphosphate-sugar epimerase